MRRSSTGCPAQRPSRRVSGIAVLGAPGARGTAGPSPEAAGEDARIAKAEREGDLRDGRIAPREEMLCSPGPYLVQDDLKGRILAQQMADQRPARQAQRVGDGRNRDLLQPQRGGQAMPHPLFQCWRLDARS